MPALFMVASIALLGYSSTHDTAFVPALLAAGGLVTGVLRFALTFKELEALTETRRQALTDDLTGLANRRHLSTSIDRLVAASTASETRFAMLIVDLDGFKTINDTLGHAAGDGLPESSFVARLGGDEFAIVVRDAATVTDPAAAARRVLALIGEPFEHHGLRLRTEASIGIARFPKSAVKAPCCCSAPMWPCTRPSANGPASPSTSPTTTRTPSSASR